jgi:hypothetical protein
MYRIIVPTRKKLSQMSVSQLDTLYWRLFSRWVRLKAADPQTGLVKCFICGRIYHWMQMDCAHFVRRANVCTRYNVYNNQACCQSCNRSKNGNLELYAKQLDRVFGIGTAEKLLYLGRQTCKAQRYEYVEGILQVNKKLDQYERA